MSTSHLFWVTARAAGIAALVLVSVSVGAGIALSGRLARGRGLDLRTAHATISIAALVMIVLHVLALLGDAWFHPTVADLLIPGVRDYREPFMAIGIVAGWLTVVFGFSYYVRDLIGVARARVVHRLTVLTWALSVAHSLGEGSDRGQAWFIAVVVLTILPSALLALLRAAAASGLPTSRIEAAARIRR